MPTQPFGSPRPTGAGIQGPFGSRPPMPQPAPAASGAAPALPPPPQLQAPNINWPPAPSGGGRGGGGGTHNSVETNPDLNWLSQKYKERFGSDTTERAISRATAGIADEAALLGADARSNLAQRGALGSGVGAAFLKKRVTDPALRASAGAASDIALKGEQRLDSLAAGGAGVLGAPAQLALGQQQLAQQQYQTDASVAAQQAQLQMEAQRQQLQQYLAFLQMLSAP